MSQLARARLACGRSAAATIGQFFINRSPRRMERLGTDYGGWHVCVDSLTAGGVALCVGAGEDVSFDVLLNARFGLRILCVDPTPRAVAHVEMLLRSHAAGRRVPIGDGTELYALEGFQADRFELVPCALWSSNTELRLYVPRDARHVSHSAVNLQNTSDFIVVPALQIETLLRQLSIRDVALLKLDVEGAEYEILRDLLRSQLRPRQLLVEFEDANQPRSPRGFVEMIRTLRALRGAGYALVHRHHSNFVFLHDGSAPRALLGAHQARHAPEQNGE